MHEFHEMVRRRPGVQLKVDALSEKLEPAQMLPVAESELELFWRECVWPKPAGISSNDQGQTGAHFTVGKKE